MIQKTMEEVVTQMLSDFANELGVGQISEASDIAIKAKVLAAQIEGLYYNQGYILKQAFPQIATGQYLDLHGYIYGVDRKQPNKARGKVRMGRSTIALEDYIIPKGALFSTEDRNKKAIRGKTTEEATLRAGETFVEIMAEAELPGKAGNVEAGAFTILNTPPIGIEYVTNLEPFTDGTDLEEEETYRKRLFDKVRSPQLGGNPRDYENWALSLDGVSSVKVLPLNRGPGTVDVLISTPGGVPSDELVNTVQQYINDRRPVGADVLVIKPQFQLVNITVKITPAGTYTLTEITDKVTEAIRQSIESVEIGGTVKLAALINDLYKLEEVEDVEIMEPSANISLASDVVAQAGEINVL